MITRYLVAAAGIVVAVAEFGVVLTNRKPVISQYTPNDKAAAAIAQESERRIAPGSGYPANVSQGAREAWLRTVTTAIPVPAPGDATYQCGSDASCRYGAHRR